MIPTTIQLSNGEDIVIRRAHSGDQDSYADVSRKCYLETRFLSRCEEDSAPSSESLLGFIEDMENSDKEILLVALYRDSIVGYGDITACLNRKKMKHKCDLNISVLKDYWHLGIGKALLDSLIAFAQHAGYEQINLNRQLESLSDPQISRYSPYGLMPEFLDKIDDAFFDEYGFTFKQFSEVIVAIGIYGEELDGAVKRAP